MYIYPYILTHAHTPALICIYISIYIYMYIYIHTQTHTHTCTHVNIHAGLYRHRHNLRSSTHAPLRRRSAGTHFHYSILLISTQFYTIVLMSSHYTFTQLCSCLLVSDFTQLLAIGVQADSFTFTQPGSVNYWPANDLTMGTASWPV